MIIIDIHEAKTQLSKLVELAAQGESFVIAKGGKPMVKVVALNGLEASTAGRPGFMADEISVPEDFDQMRGQEIETLFAGRGA
jgi:antitoxin (DNA-binding transcriptional repressor) of toxin-antitoxin stability system